jgi:hypothetical protein
MSHYAKIENGKVTQVIVAEEKFISTQSGLWIQTSYNTRGGIHYNPQTGMPSIDQSSALRKNYASIGDIYDSVLDAFYIPQPFSSWTLNEETCVWEAPSQKPNTGNYYWDEEQLQWKETE